MQPLDYIIIAIIIVLAVLAFLYTRKKGSCWGCMYSEKCSKKKDDCKKETTKK